jgi:prephenate dehydratase
MKVAVLGPKGSFSNEAALKYDKDAELVFKKTIWYVFDAIKNLEADIGIVPIENSVSGPVSSTLDSLMEFDFNIIAELLLPIKHNLAGIGKVDQIRKIYAHPQTLSQCEKFIRKYFPNADISRTSSNSKSAETVSRKNDPTRAAIIPNAAAKIYSLDIIKKNIQDSSHNVTRFIVISRGKAKKTGKDRTSVTIYPQSDKPGLLYSLLGEFANNKINLTKIESRPSKGKLGDYVFYIDFEGHEEDESVKESFEKIKKVAYLRILGSYPRVY